MFHEGVLQGSELMLTSPDTLCGIGRQELFKFNTLSFPKMCNEIVHIVNKSVLYLQNISIHIVLKNNLSPTILSSQSTLSWKVFNL